MTESLEKQRSLNMFKEDLTGMLVHDLKAPLSAVINVKILNNEEGLTFCKMAIEAHGGQIGVNSEEQQGTEFWFTIVGDFNQINTKEGDIANLSTEDRMYLYPNIEVLKNKEVYQASEINRVLKTIITRNEQVEFWIKGLEQLLFQGSDADYQKYLDN